MCRSPSWAKARRRTPPVCQSAMEDLVNMPPPSEQGNGGPADPALPLPPRFWGAREGYSWKAACSIHDDMTELAWRRSAMTEVTTKDATLASGARAGFPAGELAVMPDGMSGNRNADRENGASGETRRSSLVCCTAGHRILGEFRPALAYALRTSVGNEYRIGRGSGVFNVGKAGSTRGTGDAGSARADRCRTRSRWRRARSRRRSLPWMVAL